MIRFATGLFVVSLGSLAAAQGPGIPPLVYNQNELFTEITRVGGAVSAGHSMMHDGYLAIVRYSPGGVAFYDISNPYAPLLVQDITLGMGDLSEPHTFAQTTAYGGKHVLLIRGNVSLGGTGFAIWDWTNLFAPQRVKAYDVPGVPGGYATGLFWMFYQAPYVYCGAGSLGLFVVDASDPQNPFVAAQLPTSATGGFNAVNTLAIGNLLIVTNSDGGPGMARFDISDPTDPQLLSASTNTAIPYGIQFNGDRLLVPGVDGPVAGGGGGTNAFEIRDPYQPGFPIIGSLPLPARGGSVVLQDDFAHVAASLEYRKFDISDEANPVLVGAADGVLSGGDWDWVTPLGNLAVLGDDQGKGSTFVPHQALPDTTGPDVTMVNPPDEATNQALTSRVGITLSDMIEIGSIDDTSFIVRPVGGTALPGSYSNQFGIVNFTPDLPLDPDTTYEVLLPAGGIEDWCGNGLTTAFTSRFSTGATINAINITAQQAPPVELGQPSSFNVSSVTGPGPFQYSWDFGDGTPATPFSTTSTAAHTYADAGHYSAIVSVTNGTLLATDANIQTVHHALTPGRPTRSSTIALDETRARVWNVNADNDTVTAIDTSMFQKDFEVPVGAHPRTLAQAPDGTFWVVCQDDATIHVLDPTTGANQATIPLPYASAPFGIAMAPDGGAAYVTLRATGEVARLDSTTRTLLDTTAVGAEPKGIAVTADSSRIFVTRFISSQEPSPLSREHPRLFTNVKPTLEESVVTALGPLTPPLEPVAEVYELSAASFSLVRTLPLALDPSADTEAGGRGLPNYLSSIAVSPDGRRLWIPSKKDNIERGAFRDGLALSFESTVRTIVSQIDLADEGEVFDARVDFNDRDMAFAVELSPLGDYAFLALQGSNAIDVRDAYSGSLVAGVDGTGLAPQGLVLESDGSTLYVHNFMSRTVTAYDAAGVTSSTDFAMAPMGSVATVASEALSPLVLLGKQIFYNATDPRMNEDGYLSCATCHLDGEQDGQVWDFTDRGEGLRNTISLVGKSGTGHGNVHWTANFDEIQDFENDIRNQFGGDGFIPDHLFFGPAQDPLGAPKAGRSEALDALAAYVSSLSSFGLSPHRDPGGTLTPSAQNGQALFASLNCSSCHSGTAFTDSASGMLHDVGTLTPASGQAIGAPLTGLDTPTLRGLWATVPYLHDGSAPTLLDVLTTRNPADMHGPTSTLTAQELDDLAAYLLQIDALEPAPAPIPVARGGPQRTTSTRVPVR